MEPRLNTSLKWTSIPQELTQQIREVFSENFSELVSKGTFVVEGKIYPEELLFRIGFLPLNSIKQLNFEVSRSYSPKIESLVPIIHFCIDTAGSMLQNWIDNEETPHYSWTALDDQNDLAFIKFSTENTDLERQANILLGEDIHALLVEENPRDELKDLELFKEYSNSENKH